MSAQQIASTYEDPFAPVAATAEVVARAPRSAAISLPVKVTRPFEAQYDRGTGVLSIVGEDGEVHRSFSRDKVDSGAFAGQVPEGQVVLEATSEKDRRFNERLERAGVLAVVGTGWAAYGGLRYTAARVLLDQPLCPACDEPVGEDGLAADYDWSGAFVQQRDCCWTHPEDCADCGRVVCDGSC